MWRVPARVPKMIRYHRLAAVQRTESTAVMHRGEISSTAPGAFSLGESPVLALKLTRVHRRENVAYGIDTLIHCLL